jgi:hypothetical protein
LERNFDCEKIIVEKDARIEIEREEIDEMNRMIEDKLSEMMQIIEEIRSEKPRIMIEAGKKNIENIRRGVKKVCEQITNFE